MNKMTLSPKRLYYILAGCLALLTIISLTAAVIGNKMLTEQNKKLNQLKIEDEILEEQALALNRAKQDLERYDELEQIVKQIVPQEKDQTRTVREIVKFATESGIEIGSIAFPGSELGQTSSNLNLTQLTPVKGLSGVYNLEITLETSSPASFGQTIDFMRSLESNRRTSQIGSITITPEEQDRNLLTSTITFNVYIKP